MFQILQLGDDWGSIESGVPAALFVQTLPHLVIEASGSYNTVPQNNKKKLLVISPVSSPLIF